VKTQARTEGPVAEREFHIFVNRRKFEGARVKAVMSGREIAGLVDVPETTAVVRYDTGPRKGEAIGMDEVVPVKVGDHFLATRDRVEGGHGT
jgi:hypothetical protein